MKNFARIAAVIGQLMKINQIKRKDYTVIQNSVRVKIMKTTLKEFLRKHNHEIERIHIQVPKIPGTAEPKYLYKVDNYFIDFVDKSPSSAPTKTNLRITNKASYFDTAIQTAELILFSDLNRDLIFGAELEIEYNGFGGYQTLTAERTTFTFYKLAPCYD